MPTFASVIEQVIAIRRPTWKDADTLAGQYQASLARYAGALGPIQVSRITTADVMRVLAPHWHAFPAAADTARRRISAVLQWAIGQGYRSDDPAAKRAVAAALGAQAHRIEHHRTMPYAEVGQGIAAVYARSKRPSARPGTRVHDPDRRPLERGPGRALERDRPRCPDLDHPGRTDEGEALAPGPAFGARDRGSRRVGHALPREGRCLGVPRDLEGPAACRGQAVEHSRTRRFDTTLHGFRSAFADWARERTNITTAVAEAALAHTVKNERRRPLTPGPTTSTSAST